MDGWEVHKKLVALNSGKDFTKALLTIGVRCVADMKSLWLCAVFFGGGWLEAWFIVHTPYHPWDWYVYLHLVDFYGIKTKHNIHGIGYMLCLSLRIQTPPENS